MPDLHRTFVTDDNFIRGAARLLWAAITQATPNNIGEVVNLTTFEAISGWNDLGATKTGVQLTVNNTEETFDVDQIATDIAAEATGWDFGIGTALAEMTLERIQFAWEGGAITLNTGVTPNEKKLPLGTPTVMTKRRLAVVHRREATGKLRLHFFRKVQRTPQESSANYSKTGEQQSVPIRFRAMADSSISEIKDRIGYILDQQ